MSRQFKLRQKNGYWFSEVGGKPRYYGKVKDVSRADALKRFYTTMATAPRPSVGTAPGGVVVLDLIARFLQWIRDHRSEKTWRERKRHLDRFGTAYGDLMANEVTEEVLSGFLRSLADQGRALDYQKKHEVSIRACFRWGEKHGVLSRGFRPFALVESIRTPLKPLLETDLPTTAETDALLGASPPFLADLIRCYHATGARTGELFSANVGDYQHRSRQLVLGSHKRVKTMRDPVPRVVPLNEMANAIVARLCEGRESDAPIFTTKTGKRWTDEMMWHHFGRTRKKAGVRSSITIYSFRHLFISELLMSGVDVMLVARMAGTSVAMIEKVYGRFRAQSYTDALERLERFRQG